MAERAECSVCEAEVSVNADGGLRFHHGKKPEHYAGPDSKRCKGAGRPPQPVGGPSGGLVFLCRVPAGPRGCGHRVQLTANHRARTHLTPDGHPCAEGSSAPPIAIDLDGYRADTAEWTEEMWSRVLREPDPAPEVPVSGADTSAPVGFADLPHDRQGDGSVAGPTAFIAELKTAVGDPGTVERPVDRFADSCTCNQIDIEGPARDCPEHGERPQPSALDSFDPQDPGGPGEAPYPVWHRPDTRTTAYSDGSVRAGGEALDPFDVTHRYTDPSGTEWIHPGEAGDCRLPECCLHPRGFDWGDDGKGHSGAFCFLCGAEEPDRCDSCDHAEHPGPCDPGCFCHLSGWRTPADLLERMPEGVRRTVESNPECWDCGHEITPRASRFALDGLVTRVVWECSEGSRTCHPERDPETGWCRPQLPQEARLAELDEGECFMRHTAKPPLNRLVYRLTEHQSASTVLATVVGTGPYAGRTGELTNLSEEITCTDQHGHVRERKGLRPDPGTASTSPSSPRGSGETGQRMPSLRPSTPSAPAPTAPEAAPPTSNERPEHSGLSATAPTTGSRSTPSPSAATTPNGPQGGTSSRTPSVTGRGSKPSTKVSAQGAGAPLTPGTASGPTAKAATSATSAGRTDVADAFSTAKQAASESDRYDRYGRYKLVHPDTGKPVKWTRTTTFAKSIQDTFALSQWAQRMTLKGAALRPDIVAAVSTLEVKADKDRVNALVEDAKKAAGNKVAANLGTAVHAFTEDRDRALVGMPVKAREVPDDLMPSVDAYEQILSAFGLRPVPGLIEFTTAVKQYEVAGTSDRVYLVTRDITVKLNGRSLTLYAGEYVIGDVKTGAQLDYGWLEICIQLAVYAQGINTSGVFDWNTGTWGRPALPDQPDVLLKVRTDVAIIAHLPVDREDGAPLATLYAIDLDEGWAAAVLCGQVRTTRKKGSKLATALTVADVAEMPAAPADRPAVTARTVITRPPTLEEKARAVTTQAGASAVWKEAVAARTPKAEVDRLVRIMQEKLKSHVEQGA